MDAKEKDMGRLGIIFTVCSSDDVPVPQDVLDKL